MRLSLLNMFNSLSASFLLLPAAVPAAELLSEPIRLRHVPQHIQAQSYQRYLVSGPVQVDTLTPLSRNDLAAAARSSPPGFEASSSAGPAAVARSSFIRLPVASALVPDRLTGHVDSLRLAQAAAPTVDPLSPIAPLTKRIPPWPTPSLSPGVPSAFLASWGDVFAIASIGSRGKKRDHADGSFAAGFGLGNSVKSVALEVTGGCGSVDEFCSNGGLGLRLGRVFVNKPALQVAFTGAWQNGIQWSTEALEFDTGRQDNIYSATLSVAFPLQRRGSYFGQTFQINAGVGNSTFAPFVATGSQSQVGGFGSVGLEINDLMGVSAGWSGRGVNAQLSLTPFRDTPITVSLLGADLFNQTPYGAVGVLSVSWRTNFSTPNFAAPDYPTLQF